MTNRSRTPYKLALFCLAGTALVAACGGPRAWQPQETRSVPAAQTPLAIIDQADGLGDQVEQTLQELEDSLNKTDRLDDVPELNP